MRDPELVTDEEIEEMDEAENAFEDDDPPEGFDDEEADDEVDEDIVEAIAEESDGASPADDGDQTISEIDPDEADQDTPVPPPEADGERRWVRFSELVLTYKHWLNPRQFTGLDKADLAGLVDSIVAGTTSNEHGPYAGLWEAMEVVQIQDGNKVISLAVDGQRRYRAIEMAIEDNRMPPDPFVPVIDLEPVPVKWTALLASKYRFRALQRFGTRRDLSTYELSEAADQLRDEVDEDTGKKYTLKKIGEAIGRSESWVSKILTARENAKSSLLASWKRGEITEEQFRDLAAVKDESQQEKAAAEVAAARKDTSKAAKGAARVVAKETKQIASAKAKAEEKKPEPKSSKASKKSGPVVSGPQTSLPVTPPKRPLPAAVVDDVMATAAKKPPTHDYVKGVIAGILVARGETDFAELAKPWQAWVQHASGAKPEPKADKKKSKPKAKKGKK